MVGHFWVGLCVVDGGEESGRKQEGKGGVFGSFFFHVPASLSML
jgi:hypothetical protein